MIAARQIAAEGLGLQASLQGEGEQRRGRQLKDLSQTCGLVYKNKQAHVYRLCSQVVNAGQLMMSGTEAQQGG